MATSLNKVTLIGNVGQDPEIRETQDGKKVAHFTLATSESWKDKFSGEKKEKTEWHKVVVFVPQISDVIAKYVHKGSKVYVEGSLQTRKWLDKSNVEKYITEIVLQAYNGTLILLSKEHKEDFQENDYDHTSDNSKQQQKSKKFLEIEDDIPF